MDNVKRAEALAAANPNKGVRVTLDQVLASIHSTFYFHPAEALPDPNGFSKTDVHWTMTICLCILHNGWAVVGKSAPADPAMANEEIGRKLAHEDCIRQIWPLLGFLLRQTIHENFAPTAQLDPYPTHISPEPYGPPWPGEKS